MQSYIRTVYESSAERGHLCPCSTVRDIRSYTNELIKKRHPKFSNKRVMETTNNAITNAGQELQNSRCKSSWKASSVKTEKDRIKKFIADTLNELMRTPESYAAFKAKLNEVPTTSTPKKIPERSTLSRRSLSNQTTGLPSGKAVNKKLAVFKQQNDVNDPFKTPDRKIKPKVASESKIVTGLINYEAGKPIITCPDSLEKPRKETPKKQGHYLQDEIATLDLNASLWLTHAYSDPAESPFNHGCNSIDDSTIYEEDLLRIEPEQNDTIFDDSLEPLNDSIEDISDTPKRGVNLPNLIKRLEQHFSEMNASLLESSRQHAKRKRADSLSAVQHLIDKFVPENTPSPQMRKRSNSMKNSTPNIPSGPMIAQHIHSSPVAVNQPNCQMFNGKCQNLLDSFQAATKTIKMHVENENTKFNNSMNKLRIDSMFPRMPSYNTPYVPRTAHQDQDGGRKRSDSLNFDSLDSLEHKLSEGSHGKYERKRGNSLNLDQYQEDSCANDTQNQKIECNGRIAVPRPEGIISELSTGENLKDLKRIEVSRVERINNKIDELSGRIHQMKMNLLLNRAR